MNAIVPVRSITNRDILIPDNVKGDVKHRLGAFCGWLETSGRGWHEPNLEVYRDELLTRMQPASVKVHLSTIRAHYRRLMKDNEFISVLYGFARQAEPRGFPADHKAMVDEMLRKLSNDLDPENSPVQVITEQDVEDEKHLRLTVAQANQLMADPLSMWKATPMRGLRDVAIIALMLCTGIREAELCALDVDDLRQRFQGDLALRVRKGKRAKKRMIPYGNMDWVLVVVDKWLTTAGIEVGAVFQGFVKGNKRLNGIRLSVRSVERMLEGYSVVSSGNLLKVQPHDLRRTYARRLYDSGVSVEAIQKNMGHEDTKTTLRYIGNLDSRERSPGSVFTLDLRLLG